MADIFAWADHCVTSELKRIKYGFCERLRVFKNNVTRERIAEFYSLSCSSTTNMKQQGDVNAKL